MLTFLAGIGGGWAFFLVWRRFLPRSISRRFWLALPAYASAMVRSERPDDVVLHYRALVVQAARFGTRSLLGVAAGLVPVAVLFLLADAPYRSERRVPIVEVQPALPAVRLPQSMHPTPTADGGMLIDRRDIPQRGLRLLGETLDREDLSGKQAFCRGWLSCLGYNLMFFETYRLQERLSSQVSSAVVLRPRAFDANPFWPILDDLEFAFLAGALVGSLAAGWLSSRRRPRAS